MEKKPKLPKSGQVIFKEYHQHQSQLLPPSLEELIPEKHLVRIINQLIDSLAIKALERPYRGGGSTSYHPKMMLKVIIYAYCTKVYSCRQIADSLQTNIHFMWLSASQRPTFKTINNFRSVIMKDLIEEVFGQVLTFLLEDGYIKLENYFVDGTKLRADANKNSHLWAANTKRYKAGVSKRIKELLTEIDQLNEQEEILYGDKHLESYGEDSELTSEQIQEKAKAINEKINHRQAEKKITTQQAGKGKSQARQLAKDGAKLATYEQQEKLLNGRNSYSKTDPDATFMRMKDGQLLPAYNIIEGSENQFIVNYTIHQTLGETNEFVPHIKELARFTEQRPKNVIGDAAYGSEENYTYLQEHGLGNYLKYSGIYFEKSAKYKENPFHKDNFAYDPHQDQFTCPANQAVEFEYETRKKTKSGYQRKIRVYECSSCRTCSLAEACKRGKNNRQIKFSPAFEGYKKQVKENLSSELGMSLSKQRGVCAETPFGDIKHNMGYRRFRLRGLEKVHLEWGLVSIAHNLRKVSKLAA
jgi:transposase